MAARDESICTLTWNGLSGVFSSGFHDLFVSKKLVDVTLACEGQFLQAHKVILAVCSPYFQSLFQNNECPHPIVVFKDFKFSTLKHILNYIYSGVVTVKQVELSDFFNTASFLDISGLNMQESKAETSAGDLNASIYMTPPSHCNTGEANVNPESAMLCEPTNSNSKSSQANQNAKGYDGITVHNLAETPKKICLNDNSKSLSEPHNVEHIDVTPKAGPSRLNSTIELGENDMLSIFATAKITPPSKANEEPRLCVSEDNRSSVVNSVDLNWNSDSEELDSYNKFCSQVQGHQMQQTADADCDVMDLTKPDESNILEELRSVPPGSIADNFLPGNIISPENTETARHNLFSEQERQSNYHCEFYQEGYRLCWALQKHLQTVHEHNVPQTKQYHVPNMSTKREKISTSTGKKCCPVCDKKFISASGFTKHCNKIHLGLITSPYQCNVCLFVYQSRKSLCIHKKLCHRK